MAMILMSPQAQYKVDGNKSNSIKIQENNKLRGTEDDDGGVCLVRDIRVFVMVGET